MFEHIEKLINSKGMNINQLSSATNISSQLIYAWKQGKAKPSIEKLEILATYFNVPITYFFTGNIIEKQQDNFSNEDLLLARELNKTDKIELIKDIMKIQNEKDIQLIDLLTKKILEGQK